MNKNKVAKRIAREFRKTRIAHPTISNYLINIKSGLWRISIGEKCVILSYWKRYKNKDYYMVLNYLINEYGEERCKECRISRDYVGRKTHKVGDRFYSDMPSENDHLPF